MFFALVFPVALALYKRNPQMAAAMLAAVPVGFDSAFGPIEASGVYTTGNNSIELNLSGLISNLYDGAETMFSSLAGPYLLIAGFSFGLAILMAIVGAIRLRI